MTFRAFIYKFANNTKQRYFRTRDPFVSHKAKPLVAYRCYGGTVEQLSPVSVPATCTLANNLIQPAGFVEVQGAVYDLSKEGIYRFYRLPDLSEQRVVCNEGLESLLQMVGYLWSYGDRDQKLSCIEGLQFLTNHRLIALCGNIAECAAAILDMFGVQTRLVAMMTLDEWGGQDDGHTLLEIKDPSDQWFLYDPSTNIVFLHNKKRLSLIEFCHHRFEKIDLEKLPGNTGYAAYATSSYDYDFWIAERMLSEHSLLTWYQKAGALPLIVDQGKLIGSSDFVLDKDQDRVLSRYELMNEKKFRKKFY